MSASAITSPTTLEIAPRIYVYTDGLFNAGYVLTDEGVLVIDSLLSPGYSRGLLESIKKITSLPIRYLFYTHYHLDHTGGSPVLQQAGATTHVRKRISEKGEKRRIVNKVLGRLFSEFCHFRSASRTLCLEQ